MPKHKTRNDTCYPPYYSLGYGQLGKGVPHCTI